MQKQKQKQKQKRRFTKRKRKAGVLGANAIPFLLKEKLSQVHNATYGQEYYNSALVDNILSHLPIQGVNEAITEHIIKNPVPFPTWSRANYSYPFQPGTQAPGISRRAYELQYPLIAKMPDLEETYLIDTIYGLKNDAEIKEYPPKFIKILLGNFLAFSKKRRASSYDNYILSRIPNYELQRILTTNKFFIIDVDFLIKKFNLTTTKLTSRGTYSGTYRHKNKPRLQDNRNLTKKYKSYSAYISKKITDIIFDHLLVSYQAYWAIKHTIKIIIGHIKTLHGRQPGYSLIYCRGRNIGDRVTDTSIDGETIPFREVWHDTVVGKAKHNRIKYESAVTERELPWSMETPETTNISPFDVLEYYILILNKELRHLANYKISIVELLITSVNKHLYYIKGRMTELYGCFDNENPPLSYTGFEDMNFAVFEIIIQPFKDAHSLKLRPNSAIPDANIINIILILLILVLYYYYNINIITIILIL